MRSPVRLVAIGASAGGVEALPTVCIAPGNRHLRVARDGALWGCRVGADAPVNRHRPSIDVLVESPGALQGSLASGSREMP